MTSAQAECWGAFAHAVSAWPPGTAGPGCQVDEVAYTIATV